MSGAALDGMVVETGGGVYRIRTDDGDDVEAVLRGRLKRERRTGDKVVIGDRVSIEQQDDAWVVEAVHPRRTEFARRGPGGRRPKLVAANLDAVLIVIAARDPSPSRQLVDRLLAVCEASGLEPVLAINKVDLPGAERVAREYAALYRRIGYVVVVSSAVEGDGIEELRPRLCAGTWALVGPSGAGKSTLLNTLDPSLGLRTGELSRKTGRGRHTTVSSRLILLACGGSVADTPGFGDVGLWGILPERVEGCFPEIAERAELCRFRGCAHVDEPGCAVKEAVGDGGIDPERYESYVTLRREAQE